MIQTEQWHPSDIEAAESTKEEEHARPRLRRKAESEAELQDPLSPAPVSSTKAHLPDRDTPKTFPEDERLQQDIGSRLKETSQKCLASYQTWQAGNGGELELTNSLHEVRRVLARIEIELAASHADESSQRRIPIPMHRSHKGSDRD